MVIAGWVFGFAVAGCGSVGWLLLCYVAWNWLWLFSLLDLLVGFVFLCLFIICDLIDLIVVCWVLDIVDLWVFGVCLN